MYHEYVSQGGDMWIVRLYSLQSGLLSEYAGSRSACEAWLAAERAGRGA